MFTLEKYKTKSTRHTCPSCDQKYVFARYVDEAGESLADDVGRCNREAKCGYHRTPKEHFADNPTERNERASRPVYPRAVPHPKIEAKPLDTMSRTQLEKSLTGYARNGLVQFLLTRFDAAAVNQAVARYLIGTDSGRCVFWQVDGQGRIRTGKLIAYNPATGKRRKEANASWSHAELKNCGALPDSFELAQCFFGEHLLKAEPSALVGIVEAEKTAVIASLVLPEFAWLACGGKTQLSAERLATLRNRRVLLFPDGDAFTGWQAIANQAAAQGLDVRCSDLIEQQGAAEEKAEGFDLADFLLASAELRPATTSLPVEPTEPQDKFELRQAPFPQPGPTPSARIVEKRLTGGQCPTCGGWLLRDQPAHGVWCGACRLNWFPEDFTAMRATFTRRRERDAQRQATTSQRRAA